MVVWAGYKTDLFSSKLVNFCKYNCNKKLSKVNFENKNGSLFSLLTGLVKDPFNEPVLLENRVVQVDNIKFVEYFCSECHEPIHFVLQALLFMSESHN